MFSVAPKLWLITSPRLWSITYCSAPIISGKPVMPSVSATGVSTSRMFAPGAIAWAYSTSSVVSSAQPTMLASPGLNVGTLPTERMVRAGGSGKPHCRSNTDRSLRMVGEPNESTITIVRPFPVTFRRYSGFRS